jgi:hypothetical protein
MTIATLARSLRTKRRRAPITLLYHDAIDTAHWQPITPSTARGPGGPQAGQGVRPARRQVHTAPVEMLSTLVATLTHRRALWPSDVLPILRHLLPE